MAIVYLARDLKHGRQVAIKVLHPELSTLLGADRFLREIQLTARLQHPNILPLFDSGEADSLLYYVMPYVAGETLRARLERERALPVADALHIATSALAGLGYAHAAGILHRDLKPENILLAGGQAILADFGIALAVTSAAGKRLTETGFSLGTPQYMSPEQATGDRDLDARSDLYAMGCVLYEMLTGDPPHTGRTVQAIVAKVISERPAAIRATREMVPPHVEAAVLTALAKWPADRFASAAEFSQALAQADGRTLALPAAGEASGGRWRRRFGIAAGAALLAGAAAIWGWTRRPADAPSVGPVARATIDIPADQQIGHRPRAHPFDLSPDGAQLVYVAASGSSRQLYLRRLDADEPRAIPGTQEANQPFFSPDGRWIGFFADGKLQKVAVAGGAPIQITSAPSRPTGASWGDDGTILYHLEDKGLFRVSDGGGAPARIEAAGELGVWPHVLPGARHALVTIRDSLALLTLATGELRMLLPGSQARYLPTGHLLYAASVLREVLQLVPFDLERLRVTGAPLPALDNVFRGEASSAISFAVSRSGVLVYIVGGFRRSLVWVHPNGREEALPVEPMGYRFPDLSPDGRYLAVTIDPRPSDIWVLDLERPGNDRRLSTPQHEIGSVWSRDGRGFLTNRAGLVWVPWPAGEPRRVDDRALPQFHPTWMADGRIMAFEPSPESGDDLILLDPAARTSDYFLRTSGNERMPSASPDGKWVAFASDQTGTFEVYVVSYPVPGEQHRVSTGGGIDPRWAANGNIYYQNGTTIMAAAVRIAPRFSVVGSPRAVTDRASGFTGWWDVAPDGRLLLVRGDRRTMRQFQVVFNWFEEIRAKTPGR